ncbi:MAG: hypothetical protein LBP56_04825 [Odoribacteraceae bacterium]|jgi:hypothetical protein|nr:hypothetical protein [Odoribacteraceae bacterium]
MKHAEIYHVPQHPDLRARLTRDVPAIAIAEVNWPGTDLPRLSACCRIGYDNTRLLLAFEVEERQFRANEPEDNGRVWEDSCVEFFIQPGDPGEGYYNFECNAIGTLLLAHGTDRHDREPAPREVLASIPRETRVEVTRQNEEALYRWSLLLAIPFTALFRHRFTPQTGKTVLANFYKCGDKLPFPHFLSWNPVTAATPDFHRPECFGRLSFQP